MHPPIQIVDDQDKPTGVASMQEAQEFGLRHRVVRVMLENEAGEVLLQKRAASMLVYPNCWDNSAAGHVDAGEDYLQAAEREMQEEIGVSIRLQCVEIYKTSERRGDKVFNRFNAVYKGTIPKDTRFTLQPEEVSEVKWVSREELKQLIAQHPEQVTDGLEDVVKRYY